MDLDLALDLSFSKTMRDNLPDQRSFCRLSASVELSTLHPHNTVSDNQDVAVESYFSRVNYEDFPQSGV